MTSTGKDLVREAERLRAYARAECDKAQHLRDAASETQDAVAQTVLRAQELCKRFEAQKKRTELP